MPRTTVGILKMLNFGALILVATGAKGRQKEATQAPNDDLQLLLDETWLVSSQIINRLIVCPTSCLRWKVQAGSDLQVE